MSSDNIIHVDPGGFANFFKENGLEKTVAIVDIYEKMGVDVANVSMRELADDADRFISLISDKNTHYISANLINSISGKTIFPSHAFLNVNGHRIAVIGVTQRVIKKWELADGSTITTADPGEILPPLVKSLSEESDAIILLVYMPKIRLNDLLNTIADVDIVIGADGYSITTKNQDSDGGIPVSYAGNQGQALGFLRCEFTQDGFKVIEQKVERLLTDDFPEDSDIKAMVDKVTAQIEQKSALN